MNSALGLSHLAQTSQAGQLSPLASLLSLNSGASLGQGTMPIDSLVLLALLSLLPFLAMMVTSFTKIAVVLGILRSALGSQNLPPSSVLTALALLLSFYVMAPVATASLQAANLAPASTTLPDKLALALPPWVEFLSRNTNPEDLQLFQDLAEQRGTKLGPNSLQLLVPAFMISELREAFRLGFLIFLPFLVVDLATSAIVLSLGMHMLSPTTLSLPLKLLLFVAADGWHTLCQMLIGSYLGS